MNWIRGGLANAAAAAVLLASPAAAAEGTHPEGESRLLRGVRGAELDRMIAETLGEPLLAESVENPEVFRMPLRIEIDRTLRRIEVASSDVEPSSGSAAATLSLKRLFTEGDMPRQDDFKLFGVGFESIHKAVRSGGVPSTGGSNSVGATRARARRR